VTAAHDEALNREDWLTQMIDVQEADALIVDSLPDWGCEQIALEDAAGRILAQDVTADRDLPPYDRVMMDGIAVRAAEWARGTRRFALAGTQAAGRPRVALPEGAVCVEVMTGAPLPQGADCILPVELLVRRDGVFEVSEEASPGPGRFIHPLGSDAPEGSLLVRQGAFLTAPALAAAATVGLARVWTARAPSIGVLTTGDEVVPVEARPEPHQIRQSNGTAIGGMCRRLLPGSAVATAHAPDEEGALERIAGEMLDQHDVLILTGGVSRGRFDFVPGALERLGAVKRFHRVAQRPGKPLWFGVGPQGQLVFGLPGNPVSGVVGCRRYVIRHLRAAQGACDLVEEARLMEAAAANPELTRFAPVQTADGGGLRLAPAKTSGDVASLANTIGFCELARNTDYPPNASAPFYRWDL
jgi:molybdopterin molybdotransferase